MKNKVIGLVGAFVLGQNVAWGAKKTPCNDSLVSQGTVTSMSAAFRRFPLSDLLVADEEANLAVKFPAMLMDASQHMSLMIGRKPAQTIKEPTYRVREVPVFPTLAGGGAETGDHRIIGHYEALKIFVEFFGQSQGRRLPLARGGPGTGKTELLVILTELRANLSATDPAFTELTFEWQKLNEIPYLRDAANPDGTRKAQIERSPLVLLPDETRAKVIEYATPSFVKRFGVSPHPFVVPDPQTREIIEAIMRHKFGDRQTPPSDREYFEAIAPYVVIVQRRLDPKERVGYVPFQGNDPNMSRIFVGENLAAMSTYGPGSALSYDYTGIVARADGGVVCLDELFRQKAVFRDHALELVQNHRIDVGGAPSVELNVVVFGASNDESIREAMEDGGAGALLDRAAKIPMRASINPLLVAPLALHERLRQGTQFVEWPIGGSKPEAPKPLNVLDVYPLEPRPDGVLKGPEGRFGLAVVQANGRQTLVAPHALSLMAMTAAATRQVTDPAALKPYAHEFDLMGIGHQLFLDPAARLEVILGISPAEPAVRKELEKIMGLLAEGEGGISARQLDIWFESAISLGGETGAITPSVVTRAFQRLLDLRGLEAPSAADRAKWISIHNLIKERLTLPAIAADVNAILSGDPKRVERIYDEVRREIIALSNDPSAVTYQSPGGDRLPIARDRLRQLEEIYYRVNHRRLVREEIRNFHVTFDSGFDSGLMRAIHEYVLDSAINVAELSDMMDALNGRSQSPEIARRVQDAMTGMEQLGYDKTSFTEALRFIRDQQLEKARAEAGPR